MSFWIFPIFSTYFSSFNIPDLQAVQETRIPLQIWVTQKTNGLLVEEGGTDGNCFLVPFASSENLVTIELF